jgi:hypothetical protein
MKIIIDMKTSFSTWFTNFKFQILVLIILCISIENKGNIVKTNSKDSKSF